VAIDPNQPQSARDEAVQQLDGLTGATAQDDLVTATVANEKPGDFDGEKAAKRVLESSRHTDLLSDNSST
jgi:hypothetical protein